MQDYDGMKENILFKKGRQPNDVCWWMRWLMKCIVKILLCDLNVLLHVNWWSKKVVMIAHKHWDYKSLENLEGNNST
jgi:hypothetical protein